MPHPVSLNTVVRSVSSRTWCVCPAVSSGIAATLSIEFRYADSVAYAHLLFILHWQRWKDSKFEEVMLKAMGLVVQLNHSGTFCERPIPCHSAMLVLHSNGIHQVTIRYCGCSKEIPQHLQLLRQGLYPASQLSVKTCASFQLLDLLHKLSLTTKSSTYDFYRALEKLTNNTRIGVPKLRYRALFQMSIQW